MDTFYDKTEYTINDVDSLIKNEVEESIYLDFKEASALDKSDAKKKDISKDVTAFANSDGGIIVYGIKEENHRASCLSYINGNVFTKEWLEQVINSTIQKRIPDLQIYPIRDENKIAQSIYIVKIPKSLDAPHLSKDKRFYKRFNFESVAMEEYEIRHLYGRKVKSKLIIAAYSVRLVNKESNEDKAEFVFEVDIINDGDVVEKDYKVNVYFNNLKSGIGVSFPRVTHYDYTVFENFRVKISSNGQIPIYPTEKVTAIRFEVDVNRVGFRELLQDVTWEIRLFYGNGEDKFEGNCNDMIENILQMNFGIDSNESISSHDDRQ